jgi:dGTPase
MIYPDSTFNSVYSRILTQNLKREWKILGGCATSSQEALRRRPEELPDRENIRPAFFRDTDRILHCSAYARYFDKTQVFFQTENDHVTRRVLHVQLVAKIARTLARFLELNEDLVEAIALGHDIGHAPFGHAGEACIATILEENDAGSFVHNAQSVRMLERIESGGRGLNLTLQVLDGIIGHNGEFWESSITSSDEPLCWGTLDNNVERCLTLPRKDKPETHVRPTTLEGCVVRVSDVIAYVGRDIEDAIMLKLICEDDLPKDAVATLGRQNREIINNLAMDLIHNSTTCSGLHFSEEAYRAMKTLLEFNYKQIYGSPVILKQKVRFERIVRELFETYLDDLDKGNEESAIYVHHLMLMDAGYAEEFSHYRIVADFIAGMTDRFLLGQYMHRFMPERIGYCVAL